MKKYWRKKEIKKKECMEETKERERNICEVNHSYFK